MPASTALKRERRKAKALRFSAHLNLFLSLALAAALAVAAHRRLSCTCEHKVSSPTLAEPSQALLAGPYSSAPSPQPSPATSLRTVPRLEDEPADQPVHIVDQSRPLPPCDDPEPEAAWPTVLILSPCQNCVPWLGRHFRNIRQLQYPKSRISIAFLVGDSDDNNRMDRDRLTNKPPTDSYTSIERIKKEFPNYPDSGEYRSIQIIHKDFVGGERIISREERHLWYFQKVRRSIMARSRNYLLQQALKDEDYVLWIDIDVRYFTPQMLIRLLTTKKDVVVPNVVNVYNGLSYDRNSWQRSLRLMETFKAVKNDQRKVTSLNWGATAAARADMVCLPDWDSASPLQVEGYHDHVTGNLPLSALHGNGSISILEPVDGVGGAVLLVKGELHREGLIFPTFPYRQRIETEGLAMMAIDMGAQPYGLPNYEVIH